MKAELRIISVQDKALEKEVSIRRLLKLNAPEWPYMVLGTLAAICQGAILPFYAVIFGDFLGALSIPETAQEKANQYSLLFVAIGIGAGNFISFHFTNFHRAIS